MSLTVEQTVFEEAKDVMETTTWKLAHHILSEWVDVVYTKCVYSLKEAIWTHLYKLVRCSLAVS